MKLLPIYVAFAAFVFLFAYLLCDHMHKHDAALPLDARGNIVMQK
jgi:hypothetical protein